MSQTTSTAPARVRPRRWRRLLLALLFLVLSGAGGILYFLWSSEAALTEIIAEIDRRDPGTDLGFRLWDIFRRRQPPNPPVADNENPLK